MPSAGMPRPTDNGSEDIWKRIAREAAGTCWTEDPWKHGGDPPESFEHRADHLRGIGKEVHIVRERKQSNANAPPTASSDRAELLPKPPERAPD